MADPAFNAITSNDFAASKPDYPHHRFFGRSDDSRFESRGLDRGVRIFESVPRHGRGDETAFADDSAFNAFLHSSQACRRRGLNQNAFGPREQLVSSEDFVIRHFVNVATRL